MQPHKKDPTSNPASLAVSHDIPVKICPRIGLNEHVILAELQQCYISSLYPFFPFLTSALPFLALSRVTVCGMGGKLSLV